MTTPSIVSHPFAVHSRNGYDLGSQWGCDNEYATADEAARESARIRWKERRDCVVVEYLDVKGPFCWRASCPGYIGPARGSDRAAVQALIEVCAKAGDHPYRRIGAFED